MSCHDIGRGLNEVVRMTIAQFDKGEVTRNAAIKIIATCAVAVNWCDGNKYEALQYIINCRCGKCLKLVPKGKPLYDLYALNHEFVKDNIDWMSAAHLAGYAVCDTCFDEVMQKLGFDSHKSSEAKRAIKKLYKKDPSNWRSEGIPPEDNNGYRWVRDIDWYDD